MHPQNEPLLPVVKFGLGASLALLLAFWLFGEAGVMIVTALGVAAWFLLVT